MKKLLNCFCVALFSCILIGAPAGCGGSGEPTRPEEFSPFPPEDTIDSGKASGAEESEG